MEGLEGLIALGGFALLLGPIAFVLAIITMNQIGQFRRGLAQLRQELEDLKSKGMPAIRVAAAEAKVEREREGLNQPEAPRPVADAVSVSPSPKNIKRDLEGNLASRWFVWIGAAAVALAGLLFVKYAADNQLVSPLLRVFLGLLLSAALVAAGEYSRRTKSGAGTYVPAALASGGLVTAFGSIYAAHALYTLLSPMQAFAGLAVAALAALALSRLQGPLVAAVGLIGSYATPALVVSEAPNAWGFFPYLLVIVAACFAILRVRPWWWLGHAAILGAALWGELWILPGPFQASDAVVIGVFAYVLVAISGFALEGRKVLLAKTGNLLSFRAMSQGLRFAAAGTAAAAVVLASQVISSSHSFLSLLFFMGGMFAIATFSWVKQGPSLAAVLAGIASLIVLATWPEISLHQWAFDENGFWVTVPGRVPATSFRNWMLASLAGFAGLGAAGYIKKTPDLLWAALAAGAAFLFPFALWARAEFVFSNTAWAIITAGLALGLAALAYRKKQAEFSPALLLGGSALLLLFAIDRVTDDVWQTLLIAALAVAFAWATRIFTSVLIGLISSAVASLAALRLFVDHSLWSMPQGLPLGDHWPLYGYGLPVVEFRLAAKLLKGERLARYRIALEGISLGLLVSLVSLELRALIAGGNRDHELNLLELGAHVTAWLGAAYGLAYRQKLYSSLISNWGARLLLLAGSLTLVLGAFFWFNPLVSEEPVAGNAVFNSLLLAYLAPAALIGLTLAKTEALGLAKFRSTMGMLALMSLLAYVTLEVKRLFQGPHLIPEFSSDAESYWLSAAWLALAVTMFIAGLKWTRAEWRYAGLGVMVLALLKTFGYDLWQLGGLWQIASVMGIGLSLVGVGWLYARFMRREISHVDTNTGSNV